KQIPIFRARFVCPVSMNFGDATREHVARLPLMFRAEVAAGHGRPVAPAARTSAVITQYRGGAEDLYEGLQVLRYTDLVVIRKTVFIAGEIIGIDARHAVADIQNQGR